MGKNEQREQRKEENKKICEKKKKRIRESEIIYVFKTSLNLAVQTRKGTDRQMDWIGSRNQVCSLPHPIINFPVERVRCIGQSSRPIITGRDPDTAVRRVP